MAGSGEGKATTREERKGGFPLQLGTLDPAVDEGGERERQGELVLGHAPFRHFFSHLGVITDATRVNSVRMICLAVENHDLTIGVEYALTLHHGCE